MNEARPNGLHFPCFFARVACLWEQFQVPSPASNLVEKKETIQSLDFLLFSLDMEWAVAKFCF